MQSGEKKYEWPLSLIVLQCGIVAMVNYAFGAAKLG